MLTTSHCSYLALSAAVAAVSLCSACEPPAANNTALFSIIQSPTANDGAMKTTASYELLQVDGQGQVRRSAPGNGRCYIEAIARRITSAPGLNAGVATFRGASLPVEGLKVLPENVAGHAAVYPGAGWDGGERLEFDASGFSMPAAEGIALEAPPARIELLRPALDDATSLHVSRSEAFRLQWTPIPGTVLASFRTTGNDQQALYCFFDAAAGGGTFEAGGLAQLPEVDGAKTTGVLEVTLHAETSTMADDWNILVIADSVQGSRAFVTSW